MVRRLHKLLEMHIHLPHRNFLTYEYKCFYIYFFLIVLIFIAMLLFQCNNLWFVVIMTEKPVMRNLRSHLKSDNCNLFYNPVFQPYQTKHILCMKRTNRSHETTFYFICWHLILIAQGIFNFFFFTVFWLLLLFNVMPYFYICNLHCSNQLQFTNQC